MASDFGNEGTGGHSHLIYAWKTGQPQRFTVTAKAEGEHTDYSGWWFHPEQRKWILIASFRAPADGKWLRGLYSFNENFGGANGHLQRKALSSVRNGSAPPTGNGRKSRKRASATTAPEKKTASTDSWESSAGYSFSPTAASSPDSPNTARSSPARRLKRPTLPLADMGLK